MGPEPEGLLFTDQYQLTMAQLYHSTGMHEKPAVFDYYFRTYPDYGGHAAGFCVFAGLDPLLDWIDATSATAADVDHLRSLRNSSGAARFADPFLEWIEGAAPSSLSIDSVAEGRVIHPAEPVLTVTGSLAVAQLIETSVLNHLNYPTLIATKAARVAHAAAGRPFLEFGMRRGPRSAVNDAARAALIGGADATSNVAASARLGVDPVGTHAHSMVQAFVAAGGSELDAFRAYASVYPDDCVLLVDTIDTLSSGVPNAIAVFAELRAAGHDPRGIRLDSGDLAALAVEAARMLDEAGFPDTTIVLSGDLDEIAIEEIRRRVSEGAAAGRAPRSLDGRLSFGVGTKLITSHGDPSLDGVYKLAALETAGEWRPASKRSDSPAKASLPGRKALWRLYGRDGRARGDVISLRSETVDRLSMADVVALSGPAAGNDPPAEVERLHAPVFDKGRNADALALGTLREHRRRDIDALDAEVRRLVEPAGYPVAITRALDDLRNRAGAF